MDININIMEWRLLATQLHASTQRCFQFDTKN